MKIVLLILAALFLLLLCPIRLSLHWKNDLTLTAGWLFLKFKLLPKAEKTKKKAAVPEQAAAAPNKAEKAAQAKPSDTLTQYADLLPDLLGSVKNCVLFVLRHTKVKRLDLNMLVSREDAAETAIAYGRANQAVYTALGLLQSLLKFGCRPKINIGFDYLGREEEAEAWAAVSTAPLFVLLGGIGLLLSLLKGLLTREKEKETVHTV
ncbi:MAG: DUF2953 domain-containing protein [Oscillospiraceae bacterium]|nr:DUF2953 domain-containing protein [Oscillospiraceae bacterium]